MLNALKWLFKTKARVAALAAVLYAVLAPALKHFDVANIGPEQVAAAVGALATYVLGLERGKELPAPE